MVNPLCPPSLGERAERGFGFFSEVRTSTGGAGREMFFRAPYARRGAQRSRLPLAWCVSVDCFNEYRHATGQGGGQELAPARMTLYSRGAGRAWRETAGVGLARIDGGQARCLHGLRPYYF